MPSRITIWFGASLSLSPLNSLRPELEVEGGQVDLLAGVQVAAQVLVEQLEVDGLDVLEVVLALSSLRRVLAVHEIVVHLQVTGCRPLTRSCTASRLAKVVLPEEEGPAMSSQRGRGFASKTRSAICAIFFSWSASADADEVGPVSLVAMSLVQAADRVDARGCGPTSCVPGRFGTAAAGLAQGGDARRRAAVRELDHEARLVGDQAEVGERAGGGGQRAVGEVGEVLAAVDHHLGRVAVAQQVELVGWPWASKQRTASA
jgi:hypothetical protein